MIGICQMINHVRVHQHQTLSDDQIIVALLVEWHIQPVSRNSIASSPLQYYYQIFQSSW
jgi:hypothetical protein